jgi:hypothetical protein
MRLFFTKQVTVFRLVAASSKETYTENGTINGFIVPISAEDSFLTEGNPAQTYKLVADYGADIQKTDKLTYDDEDYIVTGVQKFDFGAVRRKEAILQKFNS